MKTSFFNKLFKPFRFFSRMSERLTRYLSDLQDMAPYHIRMMSQSYSGKSNTFSGSDFSRREHLIYSWLSMDHVYFGKVSSEAARHWIALGDLHSSELYPASGRRFFEKAVGILRQIKDADDPVLLAALKKLADCYVSCTRDNEALALYLEIAEHTGEDGEVRDVALADLKRAYLRLEDARNALAVSASLIERAEARGYDSCLLSAPLYKEMADLYAAVGDSRQAEFYASLHSSLDWYSIMEKSCGKESRQLKPELEKLVEFYRRSKRSALVDHIRTHLEMIDLTALVSGAEYPAIESDLHRLAELHELRNEGADKTVAFHYRAKARRIKERREGRTKFKSMLAGFFISINSIQEALYVVAYEYAADIGFALSAFL